MNETIIKEVPTVSCKNYLNLYQFYYEVQDGGGGIRTHGTLADTLVFKTRALNHSTTPPGEKY